MVQHDDRGEAPATDHRRARLLAVIALVAGLLVVGYVLHSERGRATGEAPAAIAALKYAADGSVLIPARAVDGVLTITIPPGTAEKMVQGRDGYVLPPVIDLQRGDRIVIRNQDAFPHLMLYAFVMPGETAERTFATTGTETYSAGCTIDPTPNGLTALFVHERIPAAGAANG